MKSFKNSIFTFMAMIPFLLVAGSANADSKAIKSSDTSPVQQSAQTDAKAIVLAKGQNNLPKRERSDCS